MKIDAMATDYLGRIQVGLLEEAERDRFDLLLETCNGLESSRIGSRYRRDVAEVNVGKVALLTLSGATPQLKGPEKWLGWSPCQQVCRLRLIHNNDRFRLLAEWERHPELASKILGLALPFRAAELGSLCQSARSRAGQLLAPFLDEMALQAGWMLEVMLLRLEKRSL